MKDKTIGSAMVVGGGIGGMQAALDLAESGIKVYMIEKSSAIGGRMVQLDKTFPTNECAMCVVSPKLVECGRHLNIDIITNTEIEKVEGEAGNFEVTVRQKARFVDMEKCTACGECTEVCPVKISSKFDSQISKHKAIHRLYPQAVPSTFIIKKNEKSPCRVGCPAGVNAHGYVALIREGKFKEALDLVRNRDPFPSICGRVCYHPCEKECLRKDIDEPIAIRALKRFIADYQLKEKDQDTPTENKKHVSDKKVAVVGSGPAGLTCAYDLIRLGHKVVVYEKLSKPGGMLLTGIPEYRLPKAILDVEIQRLISLGIEIKTNTPIGKEFTIAGLKKKYDAVFVAVGAHLNRSLKVPGEDMQGVIPGVDFLREYNLNGKVNIGEKVVIIGGGNVAIDSARSALRLGAKDIIILYRRSRLEMPADSLEIEEAQEEGIKFHFLAAPTKILGKNNKVAGIECIRMELGESDSSGRRRPVPTKGSEFEIETDLIIPAIGQLPDLAVLADNLNKTDWGTILVDPLTLETSSSGIFAGGDAVSGPAMVVDALSAGHEAAISISQYLQGKNIREGHKHPNGHRQNEKAVSTPPKTPRKQKRVKTPLLSVKERKNNFKEVELSLSEEEAVREAQRCMDCGICSECLECEKVCEPGAIFHNMKDESIKIKVGSIVVTPGVELFDANIKKEYGYDRYDNVITSIQFERLLSSSGPTKGDVLRISDNKPPKKIAFIQCVGSRDSSCGNEFCSSVCCMYSIKEAIIAKEHDSSIEPTIFYIDIRSFGKDFERYYENAKSQHGVNFVRCMISKIYEKPKSKNLMVKYIDSANKIKEAEFDMVVLAVGLTNAKALQDLNEKLGIKVNEDNFVATDRNKPSLTSRDGIYAAGTLIEPKDIPETVMEASSAASLASILLKEKRGSLIKKKEYPPEQKIEDEDVRIGAFICRCGRNIASVVNVPSVVEYAAKLDGVAYSGEFLYSCSKDALDVMKEKITEHNLNRVIVASCTPRTHEELFQDTVREAGLNRYLFEMTSLREHVSWVHKDKPEAATQKAKELVNMMVAKVKLTKPLKREFSEIIHKALVIGGGASGMKAALSIAEQGYKVYLLEKEDSLGGNLKELFYNLEDPTSLSTKDSHGSKLRRVGPQEFLKELENKVNSNSKIQVMLNAKLKNLSGFCGSYTSAVEHEGKEKELEHGVIVVAAGAKKYEARQGEFGYKENKNIITQVELEEELTIDVKKYRQPKTFVMIQCVGSRNDEHPYCSRVCCGHAVKNAIKLKEANPKNKVFVLYRDIRTYGFMEKFYLKARDMGVVFLRYDKEREPKVNIHSDSIVVTHTDDQLNDTITIGASYLILSAGMVAQDNEELGKILKIPATADGFFMEAHAKIKPLDFTTAGVFLCGLAHSPRFLHESLAQAQGASIRAVTILSKERIESEAIIACVNERLCKGCGLCVKVCPFDAREIDDETKTAKVIDVLCQGCGACCASCPSGASTHKGFTKKQIMHMIDKGI